MKILRYILAIPIGIVSSAIVDALLKMVFTTGVVLLESQSESNSYVVINETTIAYYKYLTSVMNGITLIILTNAVAPDKKLIFSIIALSLGVISTIAYYYLNSTFNVFYLIGLGIAFAMVIKEEYSDN